MFLFLIGSLKAKKKPRRGEPRKISSGQYHSDKQTLTREDKVTRIKGCATMWHESTEEICEMLKSIFRMDEDYCARFDDTQDCCLEPIS